MNRNVEEIRLVELKLCASRTSDENDDVTAVEFADFAGGNFVATFLPGRVSGLKKWRLGKGWAKVVFVSTLTRPRIIYVHARGYSEQNRIFERLWGPIAPRKSRCFRFIKTTVHAEYH